MNLDAFLLGEVSEPCPSYGTVYEGNEVTDQANRSKAWLAYAEQCCRELESIVMAIRNYIDRHGEQELPADAVSV